MKEMTKWFPPHIKPVHKGVYEVKFTPKGLDESYMYATWNGKKWSRVALYEEMKLFNQNFDALQKWSRVALYEEMKRLHQNFDALQNKYWRGFTEKQT